LGSVARIPSVPPRKPHDPGDKAQTSLLKFSVQQRQRAPFAHALTAGQTAHEYEPDGKAAEEVTQLYAWLWNELSNSIA
jgi:chromosome partitioning protein